MMYIDFMHVYIPFGVGTALGTAVGTFSSGRALFGTFGTLKTLTH